MVNRYFFIKTKLESPHENFYNPTHTCSSFPCSSGRLFQKKHDFVKIKLIDSKKIILQVETEPSPLVGLHPTECVFFFFFLKKKKTT
jgi:hypothetical protein